MSNSLHSRSINSTRNILYSLLAQMVTIVLNIVGRSVFLKILDAQYLGISTVFSSILTVLSFAELGIGSAIIYSLYEPIAKDDKEKIKSLMQFYRNAYWTIGTVVILIGSVLLPFLDVFVKERPDIPNLNVIYMILVIQSGITYFFSYKSSFLIATQQSYITERLSIFISVMQLVCQIGLLIITREYLLYLVTGVLFLILKDAYTAFVVNRKYPYLKERAEKLDKKDSHKIKKNTLALLIYRISQRISTTIDTLLISRVMGVVEVAVYSNYHLIISYSNILFGNVIGAITPSIGNLMTDNDTTQKQKFFSALQLLYYWISTYLAVGLIVLFNPLIELWLGEAFLFPQSMVVALVISITLTNFQRPCALMRDANGLFWQGKTRPLIMAIINLTLSIYLIRRVGSIGVVIGTVASKLLTFVWYDPYIVYKHVLQTGLKKYFIKYLQHWILLTALSLTCYKIYMAVSLTGFTGFLFGFVFITFVVNAAFLMIFYKSDEFDYIFQRIKKLVPKRL